MTQAKPVGRLALPVCLLLTLVIRLAALRLFQNPVVGDGAAYLAMADSLSHGRNMLDVFGQAAFYSPGYPILLGAIFALTGTSVAVAFGLNLLLALATVMLIFLLARRLGGSPTTGFVAGLAYAVWIPSIFSATFLYKENLTTPLLLGFLLTVLEMEESPRPMPLAGLAGLLFGLGLLGGTSSLLTIAAFALILVRIGRRRGIDALIGPFVAFGIGASAVLSPWFIHTERTLGSPVLTTNSGFNLYLGNNPAATGEFISIADTPMGPGWSGMRARLGEVGASDALADAARAYMIGHPGRTAELAARKLRLFWWPNIPDAADSQHGVQRLARWIDVVQHLTILALAAWGAIAWWRRSPDVAPLVLAIAGFWAIHAAAYMIIRYREPPMTLVIVLAALPVGAAIRRWKRTA